jgi:hypothetical protein
MYYEYLLLLPFCGDCQGFSRILTPERGFARPNKLFAMEQNKIMLYKKKSNTELTGNHAHKCRK